MLAVHGDGSRVCSRSRSRASSAAQAAGVVEVLHQELARRAGCWRGPASGATARRSDRDRARRRRGRAIAIRWMIALVEPPSAMAAVTALSNASAVRMSRGVRSSHTISTMRRPAAAAMRGCAGVGRRNRRRARQRHARAPRRPPPSSTPCPSSCTCRSERAMPSSISRQVQSSMVPARRSAQYFQTSLPLPRRLAAPVAAQHRPGRHEDRRQVHRWSRPSAAPGTVLSQPPSSTTPSIGLARSSSSASIASRLR